MEFDEYEYLEKSVENPDLDLDSLKKKKKNCSSETKDENGGKRGGEEKEKEKDSERRERKDRERKREREKDRERSSSRRHDSRERDRERSSSRRHDSRERERDRERERERSSSRRHDSREWERERSSSRRRDSGERERERERSRSRSRRHESRERRSSSRRRHGSREMEWENELRESRRYKEKKEAEPEADPERDQRTVFAYQMPLKATERDVYEFFSKAGKVRDVRLIMDRNSRRSKGVGYIEFYDVMSVPMAIALTGQQLLGQPVMVKPSEAEKNLVPSTSGGGSSITGPYGPTERKLYVGNLHFSTTEQILRQIFEPFGPVELVQLPLDETGQCKGYGFIQFAQTEHAKAAQVLNGQLEYAGRFIKVSSVTDHVGTQDNTGTNIADFDDDEGWGLALSAQSRAMLMQKLDRTGTASSIVASLGAPTLNGSAPIQHPIALPIGGQGAIAPALHPLGLSAPIHEPIGTPSECLLLKNLFDPAAETEPDFDLDIKEDVYDECSKFGQVRHIYVDRDSAGHVYLRFESKEAAISAQKGMHMRWFARRLISAVFMPPQDYEAKFRDGT
ncbi:RNA-binding protein 39-like protein [Drosera capensis]